MSLDARARRALKVIRECVAAERFLLLPHFRDRMALRGLLWLDVLAVLDSPAGVRDDGRDKFGRPKWVVSGTAADGLDIEIVCVLDKDEHGNVTVFITIY